MAPKRKDLMTPKERAAAFSEGTHTASETGARAEAAMHARNQMRQEIMMRSSSPVDFDAMISGKKPLR